MLGTKWWKGKRGWLRPWMVSLIAKSPKNGAEIMDEIEKMSWGVWRPSPGSVYPILDELTREGTIRKLPDGRYELTESGRSEVWWPTGVPQEPHTMESMLNEITGFASYLEDLSRSDGKRIAPYAERIRSLAERLSKSVENVQ